MSVFYRLQVPGDRPDLSRGTLRGRCVCADDKQQEQTQQTRKERGVAARRVRSCVRRRGSE